VTASRRALALLALTVLALSVRLWGITFPPYHGDEGYNYVIPAVTYFSGDLNPHRFDNPTLLSYMFNALYRVWYSAGGFDSPEVFIAQLQRTPEPFYVMARVLVALLGALTVPLVWATARRVYGPRAGWLAALFLAVAFLHVRDSHFAVSDVPVTFWLVACAYMAVCWQDAAREQGWFYALAAGLALGLAMGTKYTAAYFYLPLVWAGVAVHNDHPDTTVVRVGMLVAAMSWAFVTFMATCPYCFADLDTAEVSLRSMYTGGVQGFLGLRLTELTGWEFYLGTLGWGLGWPLLGLSVMGMLLAIVRRHRADWILLLYPIGLYLIQGNQRMVFARFILPAVPFLAIFAAYAVDRLAGAFARGPGLARAARPALALFVAGVLAWPVVSSLRMDYLLTQPDTRDQALAWVDLHIPPGSRVVREWHTPCLVSYDRLCPGYAEPVYDAELIPRAGLGTHPLSYYREQGVEYLLISSYVYNVPFYDIDSERLRVEFYRDLAQQAVLVAIFRPYDDPDRPEPPYLSDMAFGPTTGLFDLERPGPIVKVYWLAPSGPPRPQHR
jgi:4-amino-4-deoxy-L-arabinose transferase-like glycosyltransferase